MSTEGEETGQRVKDHRPEGTAGWTRHRVVQRSGWTGGSRVVLLQQGRDNHERPGKLSDNVRLAEGKDHDVTREQIEGRKGGTK